MQTQALPVSWRGDRSDRIKSAVVVIAVHALIGYAFLTAMVRHEAEASREDLKVFDVNQPPPPPVVEVPPPQPKTAEKAGSAAPANLRATPATAVAPPPRIPLPDTKAAPPRPGPGDQASAGAAAVAGPGTGAGGFGTGTGSGAGGNGSGDGVLGRHAVRERGALRDSDYPPSAAQVRAAGTVFVRFTVRTDGKVRDCRVTLSSGNEDLDRTTCRLVERRFRYRPALDRSGQPAEEVVSTNFTWGLRSTPARQTLAAGAE